MSGSDCPQDAPTSTAKCIDCDTTLSSGAEIAEHSAQGHVVEEFHRWPAGHLERVRDLLQCGVLTEDEARDALTIPPVTVHLPAVLAEQLAMSRSEARRIIGAGGVTHNGGTVTHLDLPLRIYGGAELLVGKRRAVRIPNHRDRPVDAAVGDVAGGLTVVRARPFRDEASDREAWAVELLNELARGPGQNVFTAPAARRLAAAFTAAADEVERHDHDFARRPTAEGKR